MFLSPNIQIEFIKSIDIQNKTFYNVVNIVVNNIVERRINI